MKSLIWRLAAATACAAAIVSAQNAAPPAVKDTPGKLTLRNGDTFQGVIEAFDANAGALTLRHPLALKPIVFSAAALRQYSAPAASATSDASDDWIVETAARERFQGRLIRMDAERLILKSDPLGEFSLARRVVVALERSETERVIYDGPKPGDEWVRRNEKFKVAADTVEAPQGQWVGLEAPSLPRRMRLDLTLRAHVPFFNISFYGESLRRVNDGAGAHYQLYYQMGQQLLLMRTVPNFGTQQVGSVELRRLGVPAGNRIALTLYVDLDRRRFVPFLNNRQVTEWTDNQPLEKAGGTIAFVAQNGMATITKLRIAEWNGRLPNEGRASAPLDGEVIQMINGDNLTGEILAIEPPNCKIRSPFGELTVPLQNLKRMDFRASGAGAPIGGGTRIATKNGDALEVKLVKIEKDVLLCESVGAGVLRIPMAAVREILWPEKSDDAPMPDAEE